jgi:hypothetical protein
MDCFTRLEINMGDGSGWVDFTSEYKAYLLKYAGGGVAEGREGAYQHTYTEPGEYIVQARVEYWDSQMIYSGVPPAYDPTAVVLPPDDPASEPSGGDDPEQDEWVIVPFTDPRDGTTYDIIDGRAIVAFRLPLDRPAADAFIAAKDLEVYAGWWEVAAVGVLLPAGVSVL